MTTFAYRAARPDGVLVRGAVAAGDRDAAARVLVGRGLLPIEVAPAMPGPGRRGIPLADLAVGLRILAELVESGLPLARAVDALGDAAPASWHRIVPHVRESIREGKGLAAALGGAPVPISSLVIGMVRAGENGGGLGAALRRSAEVMEESAATRAAVCAALVYPCVLACAGAASVWILVGLVLPKFAALLAALGQSLPQTTRVVLWTADAVRSGLLPLSLTLAVGWVVWWRWASTPAGAVRWSGLLLRLPLVGDIRHARASAYGAAAIAGLLDNGVPLAAAMLSAAESAGDAAVAARLLAARDAITRGERPARAIAVAAALTPTTVRLVRAGEDSGRLAAMLAHAARLERERALRATRTAVRALEPALIVVFGGIVALVAAALLQAVYSVRPAA